MNDLPNVPSSIEDSVRRTALYRQPESENLLYPTQFTFSMNRLPKMSYFVNKVSVPDFGFESALDQTTRFVTVRHPGSKLTFGNLEVTFLVDENMETWREVRDWIESISVLDDFAKIDPNYKDHFSEGTLMILTSAKNPNIEVTFENLFPISISGFEFDATATELTGFECRAVFAFDKYSVKKL